MRQRRTEQAGSWSHYSTTILPDFVDTDWKDGIDTVSTWSSKGVAGGTVAKNIKETKLGIEAQNEFETKNDPLFPLWNMFLIAPQLMDMLSSEVTTGVSTGIGSVSAVGAFWTSLITSGQTGSVEVISWLTSLMTESNMTISEAWGTVLKTWATEAGTSVPGLIKNAITNGFGAGAAIAIILEMINGMIVSKQMKPIGEHWNKFVAETNRAQQVVNTTYDEETGKLKYKGYKLEGWKVVATGNDTVSISSATKDYRGVQKVGEWNSNKTISAKGAFSYELVEGTTTLIPAEED